MRRDVTIDARWDREARIWLATSVDVRGLIVEAESWSAMMAEVPVVVAELLEISGGADRPTGYTFRAEERLELAAENRPARSHSRLSQLLEGTTPEAMREAFSWGEDVGRERVEYDKG